MLYYRHERKSERTRGGTMKVYRKKTEAARKYYIATHFLREAIREGKGFYSISYAHKVMVHRPDSAFTAFIEIEGYQSEIALDDFRETLNFIFSQWPL